MPPPTLKDERLWAPLKEILLSQLEYVHELVQEVTCDVNIPHEYYKNASSTVLEDLAHAIVPSVALGGDDGHSIILVHPVATLNAGILFWLGGMDELYRHVDKKEYEPTRIPDRARLEERVELWVAKAIEDWLLLRSRPARDLTLPKA